MNVPTTVNINTAVTLYYQKTELTSKDISAIFGCCKSTANMLKRSARAEQDKAQIPAYNSRAVNTEFAFKQWGLDIKRLERAQNHPKIRLGVEG